MQATVTDLRTDITVLHLHGELDAGTSSHLRTALADVVARPVPRIVVDLGGLRFSDSIGLSAFIINKQMIVSRGGWLSFAAANPLLQRLMESVGLTRYFAMYADVDTAVAESTSGRTAPTPGPPLVMSPIAASADAGGPTTGSGR
jgi:anti-anti-sigma factor